MTDEQPWSMEPSDFIGHTAEHPSMPQRITLHEDGLQYFIYGTNHKAYLIRAFPQADGETWIRHLWGVKSPTKYPHDTPLEYFLLPLEVAAASFPPDKIVSTTPMSLSSNEWAGCEANYEGEWKHIPKEAYNVLYVFGIENMYDDIYSPGSFPSPAGRSL